MTFLFGMRITGGKARGILIKAPRGDVTRPATDRMREAVFSSLGTLVEHSRVVDLFAGTGAYGLEAISRGAIQATFYENNRNALACLQQNKDAVLKACERKINAVRVYAHDVYASGLDSKKADLIFIDPPYDTIESQINPILKKADQIATPATYVILELPGDLHLELENWHIIHRLGKPKRDKPNAAILEHRAS